MSNVKEIERTEQHKTIWRIANDLRGSVDEIARIVPRRAELRTANDVIVADLEGSKA